MALLSPGHWSERYWAENYYSDDYWPEAEVVSAPVSTTLLTPGYWPSTHWPKGYWNDDFWQDYAAITEISTSLLTPGYWQNTYWPKGNWSDDYWQDYGIPVPTPAIARSKGIEIPVGRVLPVHRKYFSHVSLDLFVSAISRLSQQDIEIVSSYKFIPVGLLRKIDELLLIDEDLWLAEM